MRVAYYKLQSESNSIVVLPDTKSVILTLMSFMSKTGSILDFFPVPFLLHFPIVELPVGGPGHMQCAAVRTQNLFMSTPPHFASSCIGNSMSTYQGM